MRLFNYTTEKDGFCGLFSPIEENGNAAVIVLEDGHPDSYVVKTAMKWLNQSGVSAMGVGPEKYMKGVHSWPLENIENAVHFLQSQGCDRIGVIGSSFGSNMALSAAARIPEITLTIALTLMDWVYWGIFNDKIDETLERPADGESAFTWRGKPLPCMPSPYKHPDYWKMFKKEGKQRGMSLAALDLHNLAEEKHPVTEAERIPVEKINGYLILAGAKDDVAWNTCRGISRMKKKIEESENNCNLKVLIYDHCGHIIFPESMMKLLFPAFLVDMIIPRFLVKRKGM
ncbi:MAG: acyl-CoA thioester hydrolase [Lachnospiraceae bacterium]|nr:acyl-CoA thioester hydrolase [Lachnospiraceae bacterium]